MQITYFGTTEDFLSDAFVSPGNLFEPEVDSFTSTRIVLRSPDTGAVTTLTGSGFQRNGDEPSGGTISNIAFSDGTDDVATFTGLTWSLVDFINAFDAAIADGNVAPLTALFAQDGAVTIDAGGATRGFDMDDFEDFFLPLGQSVTITGSAFDDELIGGAASDTINPGANTGYDRLHGTAGNDSYDFGAATDDSYYEIEYDYVTGPLTVTADTGAGTASVTNGSFTDTFANLASATTTSNGGFGIVGSSQDDVFNMTYTEGHWLTLGGGAGDDRFNLTLEDGAFVRIFYNWDGVEDADAGIVADLGAGTVVDSAGDTDTIRITGPGSIEIAGTDADDTLTGSGRNDYFITNGGNDVVNGGDGFDRVRYDRSRIDDMTIDLAAGTASGARDGEAFTDTLTSIEYIRGSREDDTIRGTDGIERLHGNSGDDLIEGRGNDDELSGDDGNDTLNGGEGNDYLEDGAGNDVVNGGPGDDFIRSGTGQDTYNGGAGNDELRLELSDFAPDEIVVEIDLVTGDIGARGLPQNRDTVSGIENVSLVGAVSATFTGDDNDNRFESGSGNDTLIGAGGRDALIAGAGDDVLDSSTGSAESQGFGDFVRPGIGSNTIIGHAGAFAQRDGGGIDLSYADINDVGGITVVIGADGTGTAVGSNGEVDDTFSYADYFEGTQEGDSFTGSDGNEGFALQDGDDTVDGGGGFDVLYMRTDDFFGSGGDAGVVVNVATGTATDTSGATDTFSNIEEVRGSEGADRLTATGYLLGMILRGEGGDDTLRGGNGNDLIDGDDGNDTAVIGLARADVAVSEADNGDIVLTSELGTDSYREIESFRFTDGTLTAEEVLEDQGGGGGGGGTPGQVIEGTAGNDTLTGTPNDDRVAGGDGDDILDGGAGNDGVLGQSGDDTLDGGPGDDNIAGSDGNDVIIGGPGDDFLGGGEGNDDMSGNSGNDTIGGGIGNDTVSGGLGDDVVAGGPGDDLLEGGDGDDTMGGSFGSDTVRGNAGNDSLGGGTGQDVLEGGAGNDFLGGGEGDDTVTGGEGDDFLAGGGRDDSIDGGAGNDTINAGDGNDTISGGFGADQFNWNEGEAGAVDIVSDFEDGIDTLFLAGVENAPGSGLAGRVDALSIDTVVINGLTAAEIEYDGQTILVFGVAAGQLTVDDFEFL